MQSNFEVTASGTTATLTNSMHTVKTVLMREKTSRQGPDGKWVRVYVFADGHVEAVSSPDGDFDKVEKERGLITTGR